MSASTRIQDFILYVVVIGLPLFHTTRVNDVVLAKSGLVLTFGGVLGLAWLVGMACRRHLVVKAVPLYGALLAFTIASCASLMLFAGNPWRGLEVFLLQVIGFLLFVNAAERMASTDNAVRLMQSVAWTSLVPAVIGLLEAFGVYLIPTNAHVPLAIATIGNTNFVAHYLDLTIPVTASLLFMPAQRSGLKRAITATALVATCCHMLLTESRGGWVSLGLVALVFLVLKLRTTRWLRNVPVLLLSAALVSPMGELMVEALRPNDANTLPRVLSSRIEHSWKRASSILDERDPSRSMRVVIWKNTLDMISSHPFGVGTGNYEYILPDFRSMSQQREWKELTGGEGVWAYHAHNEYLEYLAETGVVGFAVIVFLFAGILWRGKRYLARQREWSDRSIAVAGCLGAVGAALIHALFTFNIQDPVSGTHFWVLAGLLIGLTAEESRVVSLDRKGLRVAFMIVGIGLAALSMNSGARILIADSYFLEGKRWFNKGKGLEAVHAMRQASEWRDADFRHHHMLGFFAAVVANAAGTDSQIGRRMYVEAESALRRTLQLHPNNAPALRSFGKMLLLTQREGEAVEYLRRTVQLDPLVADNYDLLADAYRNTGDHSRALEARKQALSFRPHDSDLMMELATEYRLSGDLEASVAVLERAATVSPLDGIVQGSLGSVYLALGRPVDAEQPLKVAIGSDASIVAWRHNLVRSLMQQRRLEEAVEELREALGLFPQDAVLQSLAREMISEKNE